jgi:dipeptidyl-peptidase-4
LQDGGFLWESDRSGFHHLYRYNANYELVNAVTQGEWDVRTVLGFDEASQTVYFTASERNPIGNDHYRVAFDGTQLKRLSDASGSHRITWNKNWTHYVDAWSSYTQTPKQALFDASGKMIRVIDDVGQSEPYKKVQLATFKREQIKTRDGFVMEAALYLPPSFDPKKKYPVFQHTYGGPMAPQVVDRWNNALWYHFLAQQGYVVFIVDNRSASNKGIRSAWPIHKKLGQLELQDMLDGIEWLRSQGWADMDRIALEGWSYGGYMTSYAMTHSTAWKVGFVGAPVTDYRLYDTIYTERYMGMPQTNAQGYDAGSVLKAVKNLHGKILIMHGTMDDNVHPQNSIMLINELIANQKEYALQLYPGHDHGVRGDAVNWSRHKAMWDFLKTHL